MNRLLIIVLVLFCAATSHAESVRLSVSEVKDTRSTGEFFNELEMKCKLTGDDVADIKGFRATVEKAEDDTGRNILKTDERSEDFEIVQERNSALPSLTLKFRNPARRATAVRQVSGTLQLFIPGRDPNATTTVKNFPKTVGTPLTNPILAKAGIQITVLTRKEYEEIKKQEEQNAKDAAMKKVGEAMVKAFEGLFGAFFQVGEHDVIFKIDDPVGKLIDLAVLDGKGGRIESHGHMQSKELRVLNYSKALPDDAQLLVYLRTNKAVITVPFRLTDIGLP